MKGSSKAQAATDGRRARIRRWVVEALATIMRIDSPPEDAWPKRAELAASPRYDLVEPFLAEAQLIYEQQDARLARNDNRATTLQATVGIATALIFAAAGVILDVRRIDAAWRPWFAVALAVVVLLFLTTGYLAARASLTRVNRLFPTTGQGAKRGQAFTQAPEGKAAEHYKWTQAMELLDQASCNAEIAWERLVWLQAARRCFEGALLGLLATAGLFLAYALGGP
jgi:hypothetical protein